MTTSKREYKNRLVVKTQVEVISTHKTTRRGLKATLRSLVILQAKCSAGACWVELNGQRMDRAALILMAAQDNLQA